MFQYIFPSAETPENKIYHISPLSLANKLMALFHNKIADLNLPSYPKPINPLHTTTRQAAIFTIQIMKRFYVCLEVETFWSARVCPERMLLPSLSLSFSDICVQMSQILHLVEGI